MTESWLMPRSKKSCWPLGLSHFFIWCYKEVSTSKFLPSWTWNWNSTVNLERVGSCSQRAAPPTALLLGEREFWADDLMCHCSGSYKDFTNPVLTIWQTSVRLVSIIKMGFKKPWFYPLHYNWDKLKQVEKDVKGLVEKALKFQRFDFSISGLFQLVHYGHGLQLLWTSVSSSIQWKD